MECKKKERLPRPLAIWLPDIEKREGKVFFFLFRSSESDGSRLYCWDGEDILMVNALSLGLGLTINVEKSNVENCECRSLKHFFQEDFKSVSDLEYQLKVKSDTNY